MGSCSPEITYEAAAPDVAARPWDLGISQVRGATGAPGRPGADP